eukprot:4904495-Amphidinium_carterae.1
MKHAKVHTILPIPWFSTTPTSGHDRLQATSKNYYKRNSTRKCCLSLGCHGLFVMWQDNMCCANGMDSALVLFQWY